MHITLSETLRHGAFAVKHFNRKGVKTRRTAKKLFKNDCHY